MQSFKELNYLTQQEKKIARPSQSQTHSEFNEIRNGVFIGKYWIVSPHLYYAPSLRKKSWQGAIKQTYLLEDQTAYYVLFSYFKGSQNHLVHNIAGHRLTVGHLRYYSVKN